MYKQDSCMSINTGSGTVTPDTIGALVPLIERGIR